MGLAKPGGVPLVFVGAGVTNVEPAGDLGVTVPPGSTVAGSVPLNGGVIDSVIVPVAEMVGVLVAVAVEVAVEVLVEVVVWVNVGVAVEADCAEGVLACMAMPMTTPNNNRMGTPIMTRARRRRSGRGGAAGAAATSAVRSVVRVASTR